MAVPPLFPRRARAPMFLRPAGYRLRRKRDAARLLPFVGFFLCVLPAFWGGDAQGRQNTAQDGLYFFIVWGVLIGLAFVMARALDVGEDADAAAADLDAVDPSGERD